MPAYTFRVSVTHHWDISIQADDIDTATNIAAYVEAEVAKSEGIAKRIYRVLRRFGNGDVIEHSGEIAYRYLSRLPDESELHPRDMHELGRKSWTST